MSGESSIGMTAEINCYHCAKKETGGTWRLSFTAEDICYDCWVKERQAPKKYVVMRHATERSPIALSRLTRVNSPSDHHSLIVQLRTSEKIQEYLRNPKSSAQNTPGKDTMPTPRPPVDVPTTVEDSKSKDTGPEEFQDNTDPHCTESELSPLYTLPPTVPSPYIGELHASHTKLVTSGQIYSRLLVLTLDLMKGTKGWADALNIFVNPSNQDDRKMLEDLLCLVTRELLPNQIVENRGLMMDLYTTRRVEDVDVWLLSGYPADRRRYDMLHSRRQRGGKPMTVNCPDPTTVDNPTVPTATGSESVPPGTLRIDDKKYSRKPFAPNIIPTLIAVPKGGFADQEIAEKMTHHVTGLDDLLLLDDETIQIMSLEEFRVNVGRAIFSWMSLTRSNELLRCWQNIRWGKTEG